MDLHFIKKEEAKEMPTILYKYRTWQKAEHKRLITHGEIYYASPIEFNEVTECNLERDYDSVTDEMIWDFCRKKAVTDVNKGKIPLQYLDTRTAELYESHRFYDLEHRKEFEKKFKQDLNKILSIFSASESPTNERLWNSFGAYKRGYCVGIDFSEIYGEEEIFGACGKVQYYDESDPPKILPISQDGDERVLTMMKIIYSLPLKFQDEDEFRFSKMNIQDKRVVLNPKYIKEVIIGSEMSPTDEEEIVGLVKEKYYSASIKKLFIEPTSGYMTIIDY